MVQKKETKSRKKEEEKVVVVDAAKDEGKISELRKRLAKTRLEILAGKMKDVRGVMKIRKELARALTRRREEELKKI